MRKLLLVSGGLAALTYTIAVVLGGLLWPEYSHLRQAISELIGTQAPNKALLDPFFAIYNLLVIAFAFGLLQLTRSIESKGRVFGVWGARILLAQGLFGFATLFFPQEPIGGALSISGTMHIVLAGLSSLTTMLAMLFFGLWLRNLPGHRNLSVISFILLAVVFVSGGSAVYGVATSHPLAGLFERVTIFGFMLWLLALSWSFSHEPHKRHRRRHQPATA